MSSLTPEMIENADRRFAEGPPALP